MFLIILAACFLLKLMWFLKNYGHETDFTAECFVLMLVLPATLRRKEHSLIPCCASIWATTTPEVDGSEKSSKVDS